MHLIPLRALSKGNLKVELQPGSPDQRVGVHALACRGQGESSAQARPRKENLARVELFDNVLPCRETTRFKSSADIRAGGVPGFVPYSELLWRSHVDQFKQRVLERWSELVHWPRAEFDIGHDDDCQLQLQDGHH